MDAWIGSSAIGTSALQMASPLALMSSDPLLMKILPTKAVLKTAMAKLSESDETEELVLLKVMNAAIEGDVVTLMKSATLYPQLVDMAFAGVTPLIFAICFNQHTVVDTLVTKLHADLDLPDTVINFTPLMWAVYLDQLESVKLLLDYQADPYLSPNDDGKNAVSLVLPDNAEIYEFFQIHNLLKKPTTEGDDFYNSFDPEEDPLVDDLALKLKLATISAGVEESQDDSPLYEEDDEYVLSADTLLVASEDFDYEKLLPEQYIKFNDSDIPSLLEYIFDLRIKKSQYQHDAKVPAAILFQLIRYSCLKVNSEELTDFLFDCFTARLRSVTNTLSGAFNMAIQDTNGTASSGSSSNSGDIVLLSYWLAVLQFLHFYLSKGGIYKVHPKFEHELNNLLKSLIAALSFSINSRLTVLVDECLLDFTTLVDVSNVLYAKDWNLFKSKGKSRHPNTYEDIINMLYPPSQNELMKPSPIRYLQVLGALDYVLNIHKVDLLIKSQTYSQVFYYINCIIFNKIISQSRYCARTKAVQVRLNLSTIEDWLRSHNFKVPDLANSKLNSLYNIGTSKLQPTIELLQFLQCISSLPDQESLINTVNQFEYLNYFQLFKIMNKLYRYEVDEPRIPKKFTQLLKSLVNERGLIQLKTIPLTYLTHSGFLSKEEYIFLNPNHIFEAIFPTLNSMINKYGVGFGGVRKLRSRKYQPSLPIGVIDEVDDILTANRDSNLNDTYDYEKDQSEEQEDDESTGTADPKLEDNVLKEKTYDFKGDQLFKTVQVPNSLAHKHWGENELEENPW